MSLANDEFAEELADMLDEAFPLADPVVLFGVCPVASDTAGQREWRGYPL
jgi:hypothetical protein